jgi:NhaA family Na+:H+ antiporter
VRRFNRMVKSLIHTLLVGLLCGGLYATFREFFYCYRSIISLCHSVWKWDKDSTSSILQHFLHKPVGFFTSALCTGNTAIVISSNIGLFLNITVSGPLGLIIGENLWGSISLVFVAVSLGICKLPSDMNWKTVIGVGFWGMGLMSIFITLLAFDDKTIISNAKFIILLSSLIAGIIGFVF